MADKPLMMFTSRTAVMKGKLPNLPVANARVAVYSGGIEREQRSVRSGLIGFSFSFEYWLCRRWSRSMAVTCGGVWRAWQDSNLRPAA